MTLLVKGQGSFDCFMNSKLAILAFFGNYMHLKVLFEAQSSMLLDPRFHFWGLDHRVLVQWLHDNNLRKEFTRSTDDIITVKCHHFRDAERERNNSYRDGGLPNCWNFR